jgi:hypothetical protein
MKTELCAGLAMAVGLGLASAAAAQDDDWEFQEDAARHISVAAVRFDGGAAVVVQCRDNALTAVLAGMPAGAGDVALQATRADGRADVQTWVSAGAAGALRSTEAHRDARFLRGGGAFVIRTAAGVTPPFSGSFDLPAQSANLDRVLTACGWPLTDDRDGVARATGEVSLVNPNRAPPRRSRSVQNWQQPQRREPEAAPPGPPPVSPAERQISCIVRNERAVDCRLDHPAALATPAEATLRRVEGERLYGDDVEAAEGKVFFLFGRSPLVVVTREVLIGPGG